MKAHEERATAAAAADTAFGTDLYARLSGPGNLVFSSASIAAALRMALIGARGQTAAEMAAVLHSPGPEAAAEAQSRLAGILAGDRVILNVVNTAWIDAGTTVRPDFLGQPVTTERADFRDQPEAARRTINAAVGKQTADKITELIGPGLIGRLTRLVLVNAIYLNARWENAFPAQGTRKAPFHREGSGSAHVDMMHMDTRLAYCRGDGYQGVLLPYLGERLAMAIVLPDGSLTELSRRLPELDGLAGVLRALLDRPERYQVDLRLPRFKVTAAFLLRDTLAELGMSLAFTPDADFSGITDDEPLWIDEVVHKAYIDVNEEGTEAAAATAVVMRTLSMVRQPPAKRVTFTADRPFLFAVVDTSSGLPLFLGQFTGP
jgi:serpin B